MKGKRTKSKKQKTSNLILIILGAFLFAFIVTMIVIFCIFQSVPDVLIQGVLGTGGLEGLLLAAIKIVKVIKGDKINLDGEDYNG